jgi:UDP-2,3-diacylglucosamine pyrophosphatase LpxH
VAEPSSRSPPGDIVVVSDLHLGRGFNAATKRWHRLEAFLYDDDFRSFCRWLCRDQRGRGGPPLKLVLNGDVFDFLRIEPSPDPGPGGGLPRPGPLLTPALAAATVRDILAGHPAFAEGLAEVLAAGHEVILLPGNHDLELQWPPVQDEVRRALAARLAERGAHAGAVAGLSFCDWFFHEPGRIWIEHGCQYDPENAFRFPLRQRLGEGELAELVAERDMPLGNFFQRYLYNAFGSITFIVPSSRANYRYFRFLLANQPRLLARVFLSHGRFLWQLLRRLARPPAFGWQAEAEAAHQAEIVRLARDSGLGDRLREVDGLKFTGADAARAAGGILRQAAKLAFGAGLATVAAVAVLSATSAAIDSLQFSVGWRTLLSLAVWLLIGTLGTVGLLAAAMRLPSDEPPRPLRAAAERIAGLGGGPLVVFGHTHEENVAALAPPGGPGGWYFNTGTWLAVFTHDVFLPRERVQFTFLALRGGEAELLHWSPERDRPQPVVLLDEAHPGEGTPG